MKYRLISNCFQDASYENPFDADFFLEESSWDDFGFNTLYHLHATSNLTGEKSLYLGVIHIMKRGQSKGDTCVLRKLGELDQHLIFEKLTGDYCSLCFSVDLYKKLVLLLGKLDQRKEFISDLHLIFNDQDKHYASFVNDDCFQNSIMRSASIRDYSLLKGEELMLGKEVYYKLSQQKLEVTFKGSEKIGIDFNCEADDNLPNRIIAFIGHNGSGKSTALYQLAKCIYLPTDLRYKVEGDVKIYPTDLGVSRMMMFSYSPFDNFTIPGITYGDYLRLAEGIRLWDGRFLFCGIRDVVREIKERAEQIRRKADLVQDEEAKANIYNLPFFPENHLSETFLKSVDTLADEVITAFRFFLADEGKSKRWNKFVEKSGFVDSYLEYSLKEFTELIYIGDPKSMFKKLSTGHKFLIHSISHLLAYVEKNSLLLFDEPENHLQPALLSFLLTEIQDLLRLTDSVMLIATHSPVVLQELFSKNVIVVRRGNSKYRMSHPEIETFGENFAAINNMVFNITSDLTRYHRIIDELYDKWDCSSLGTVEEVLEKFKASLEVSMMSTQMTGYIIGKYLKGRK